MPNCENCKEKNPGFKQPADIIASIYERTVKRLWIALIIAICLMFVTNALWLYAWCQYDYSSEETIVEQDAQDGGNANYIGNDGEIVNGLPESDNKEAETD